MINPRLIYRFFAALFALGAVASALDWWSFGTSLAVFPLLWVLLLSVFGLDSFIISSGGRGFIKYETEKIEKH